MEKDEKGNPITPTAPVEKKEDKAGVDYKALLEQEKAEKEKLAKQLGQAEFTIEDLKKKKKEESDVPDFDFDPEEAKKIAREEAQKVAEKFIADQTNDALEEELSKIEDTDKRELVKFHLENSIKRTGFSRSAITKDIKNAISLAEAPKIIAEKKEIEKALNSKETRSGGSSAGQDISKDTVTLSDAEEAQIKIIADRTGKSIETVRAKMIANKK